MSAAPIKTVGRRVYVHVDSLPYLSEKHSTSVSESIRLAEVHPQEHFNLVRFDESCPCIALLNYPRFYDDPFPVLRESWLIDLNLQKVTYRSYSESLNPPILHRKELLLRLDDPRRELFAQLTQAAESIGLFERPNIIGYKRQWLEAVREKGYRIEGHSLIPIGNYEPVENEIGDLSSGWKVSRHLTALSRFGLSAPMQSLARYGYLDGSFGLFDYGCGRGDDIKRLNEIGLNASGWDPYYMPRAARLTASIVNLGFVINVIEDFDERVDALTRAWSLAEKLLVVSVMLENQNVSRGKPFRDGVLTSRGTFQKYYTQSTIKEFIEQALDEEVIVVAPGVLYVFRDKEMEQRFLVDRFRSTRGRLRTSNDVAREQGQRKRRSLNTEIYEKYRESLEYLWGIWIALGRTPDMSETGKLGGVIDGFDSLAQAMRVLKSVKCVDELAQAALRRTEDLKVYFALNQFERRKPYKSLESGLRRDIKAFFGGYSQAKDAAQQLLFGIADVEALQQACQIASDLGYGWLEIGKSFQFHTSIADRLPSLLRVYVGCAAALYGDLHAADLIKIHIGSGKVTLMRFDDFEGEALPRMMERVKIKLRDQDIEYYAYGQEYEPPFLFGKSRYINEEYPNYPEQVAFEQALEDTALFDLSDRGPAPKEFLETLGKHRWEVKDFMLTRVTTVPDPDESCGRYFTFRQLIECGETRARTGLSNLPIQPESYNALHDLAEKVLDPVIEYFGMVRLTYGFCSHELAKEIANCIDPKRDQHAAHELNQKGRYICERRGAAVDFIVEDENMLEVAQWVVANTPFDRLYFYGEDKPIHVSAGPNNDRQIIKMIRINTGKLIPKVIEREKFLTEK